MPFRVEGKVPSLRTSKWEEIGTGKSKKEAADILYQHFADTHRNDGGRYPYSAYRRVTIDKFGNVHNIVSF